ncbi:MAG: glucose-6-phosphate dehydrogenase [Pseudomonadales bacterium]
MNSAAIDFILFGALGDLSQRKLLPSLLALQADKLLPLGSRIICLARQDKDTNAFREETKCNLQRFATDHSLADAHIEALLAQITYLQLDFSCEEDYTKLYALLADEPEKQRIFYYATAAEFFGPISEMLHAKNCLLGPKRVILEKPLGYDLASSSDINTAVSLYFDESEIYRIDHYLGKETVQNLLALRFANPIFGTQWNQNYISHVEITLAESVGIEGRWSYFDGAGQMRDMVQNHLLQLLCLVAMDPPDDLSADNIRDQKVKVLKQLKPIPEEEQAETVIRAQYSDGSDGQRILPGYNQEEGALGKSTTETYVCIKAEIQNWRWAGVPFYLRTGKRLSEKLTQIVIHFKQQPHYIFDPRQKELASNKLILRMQPNEGVSLEVQTKPPGIESDIQIQTTELDMSLNNADKRIPDAYERLLLEVVRGNQYLFVRRDEIEHAWKWCDNIMQHWQSPNSKLHSYAAGSWGPTEAAMIIRRDKRNWYTEH